MSYSISYFGMETAVERRTNQSKSDAMTNKLKRKKRNVKKKKCAVPLTLIATCVRRLLETRNLNRCVHLA